MKRQQEVIDHKQDSGGKRVPAIGVLGGDAADKWGEEAT